MAEDKFNLGMLAGPAGAAANFGLGIVTSKIQSANQSKLMREQNRAQERMMGISQQYGKDMWDYTNYENQKKHMQAAGLNPALMYGMGGGGGVTTGGQPGGSAAGGSAMGINIGGIDPLSIAQIENIKANTAKTNVEAAKLAGVDTTKVEAETEEIRAGIAETIAKTKHEGAKQLLTEAQTNSTNIQNIINSNTIGDQIDQIKWNAKSALENYKQASVKTYIAEETKQADIKRILAESTAAQLQNDAIKAGIKLTAEQTRKLGQDILMGWKDLNIKEQGVAIQRATQIFNANHPGAGQVIGRITDGMIDNFKAWQRWVDSIFD